LVVCVPEAIQDRHVVAVLRPFVRATTPMLAALRKLAPTEKPVDDADDWWINGVGRFTVLVASVPGLGGALADRLPLQNTLALAGQGLLLCAIAREHGVTDRADQVRLLAAVLFQRDIDPSLAAGVADAEAEDRATAELTEELEEASAKHGKVTIRAAGRTMWKFGKTLWALGEELDKRPQGRFYHRVLGMLPVIGMAGDYLGERSALKRAAKAARKWLTSDSTASN
jgi:hypothetical protein